MPKVYKNLFLLRKNFDELLCQVAPSVTAFGRAAKMNNSTLVYARKRGHVRLVTAEAIASYYARCKYIPVDAAMQVLFAPLTLAAQETRPLTKTPRAPRSSIQRFGGIMVRVTHKRADPAQTG